MRENEVAKIIVDVAYHIHTQIGRGLLESVYEVNCSTTSDVTLCELSAFA